MADNKKQNEIMKEQRRVYAELMELKKMESGEIKAENTHKLEDAMPKTFWGKVKNYAYHYKFLIIVAVCLLGLISFGIYDYVTKINPDIEVIIYSYSRVLDAQNESFEEILTPFCADLNGDDTVKVSVINCSYEKGSETGQSEYYSSMRFQTLIAGDPQALLFVLDKETYEYLSSVNDGETFIEGEPLMLNEEIYQTVKEKSGFDLPEGLMLCYRKVDGTLIDDNKVSKKTYKEAKRILEKMKEEYPFEEISQQEQEEKTDGQTDVG